MNSKKVYELLDEAISQHKADFVKYNEAGHEIVASTIKYAQSVLERVRAGVVFAEVCEEERMAKKID